MPVPCLLSHLAAGNVVCICADKCSEVTPKLNYRLDKQWKYKHGFCFPEQPPLNLDEEERVVVKGLEGFTGVAQEV